MLAHKSNNLPLCIRTHFSDYANNKKHYSDSELTSVCSYSFSNKNAELKAEGLQILIRMSMVLSGRGSKPRPNALETTALSTTPLRRCSNMRFASPYSD